MTNFWSFFCKNSLKKRPAGRLLADSARNFCQYTRCTKIIFICYAIFFIDFFPKLYYNLFNNKREEQKNEMESTCYLSDNKPVNIYSVDDLFTLESALNIFNMLSKPSLFGNRKHFIVTLEPVEEN